MKEPKIEILEEETVAQGANKDVTLPLNFITIGEIDQESIRIYIKQDVYKQIEKNAKEHMEKEVGSILLGDFIDDDGRKTVIVSDFIEAKFTDASAATLTFTHETWDYVYKEKDKKYQDKKIVGWQHTHPGYGIFLSNYDIFIQENFFNLPWQIAYVVDPIADTRGFFEWKNDKVAKMTGFYIYDEVGEKIKISNSENKPKRNSPVVDIVLSFCLIISILLTISFAIEKNNMMKKLDEIKNQEINVPQSVKDEVYESEVPEDVEYFKIYTIELGDTLGTICDKFDLDYRENISKIIKVNSITDINKIYAGQTLYLPINK